MMPINPAVSGTYDWLQNLSNSLYFKIFHIKVCVVLRKIKHVQFALSLTDLLFHFLQFLCMFLLGENVFL